MRGLFDPPAPPKEGEKANEKSLQFKTWVTWPCRRDPRLIEYLAVLERERAGGELERLMWVICGGVWQLNPRQADELARWFEETLRPQAGQSTGRKVA